MELFSCPYCDDKFNDYKGHFLSNHPDKNYNEYKLKIATGSYIPTRFCACGCGTPLYPNQRLKFNELVKGHKGKIKTELLQCPHCEKQTTKTFALKHFDEFHSNEDRIKYSLILLTGVDYPTKTCACGCGKFLEPLNCLLAFGSDYYAGHKPHDSDPIYSCYCGKKLRLIECKPHFDKFHSKDNFDEWKLFIATGSKIPTKFCKCGCGESIIPAIGDSKNHFNYKKSHSARVGRKSKKCDNKKYKKFKCLFCNELINMRECYNHYKRFHKNENKIEYKNHCYFGDKNNNAKLCGCGCGKSVNLSWSVITRNYEMKSYLSGHSSRVPEIKMKIMQMGKITGRGRRSKLEIRFEKFLIENHINFSSQFVLRDDATKKK